MASVLAERQARHEAAGDAQDLSDDGLLEQFLNGEESRVPGSLSGPGRASRSDGPGDLSSCPERGTTTRKTRFRPRSSCWRRKDGFDSKSECPGRLASRSCSSDRDQGACQRRSPTYTRKAGHGDVAPRNSN